MIVSIIKAIPQKSRYPSGYLDFLLLRWDSKERPDRGEGKKVSGGHFLSSWESPSDLRRIRYGCGSNSNVWMRKCVGMTHFYEKSYKNTRTKIWADPFGSAHIFLLGIGLERPLRKHAGGMFLGRGRVPPYHDASGTGMDWC